MIGLCTTTNTTRKNVIGLCTTTTTRKNVIGLCTTTTMVCVLLLLLLGRM